MFNKRSKLSNESIAVNELDNATPYESTRHSIRSISQPTNLISKSLPPSPPSLPSLIPISPIINNYRPTATATRIRSSNASSIASTSTTTRPTTASSSSTISSQASSSASNRPTPRQSHNDLPYPSPYSNTFHFPRPSSNSTFNALLELLLPQIASTLESEDAIRGLDREKQWTLIQRNAYQRWKTERQNLTGLEVENWTAPVVGSAFPVNATTGTGLGMRDTAAVRASRESGVPREVIVRRGKEQSESPEWYIARFMDGSITKKEVASLSVCLRTYHLESVRSLLR